MYKDLVSVLGAGAGDYRQGWSMRKPSASPQYTIKIGVNMT